MDYKKSTIEQDAPNSAKTNKQKDSVSEIQVYEFEEELCSVRGYFDSRKYSKTQLAGAKKFVSEVGSIMLSAPGVYKLKDLEDVRAKRDFYLKQLSQEYPKAKQEIEKIEIPDEIYWKNLKQLYLKELANEFELKKTQILAFSDPSVLKNSKFSQVCSKYSDALNSDDKTLKELWKVFTLEESKSNADPQRLLNAYEIQSSSPDFRDYAKIQIITFGWGNCANRNFRKINNDEKMYKNFEKLFTKIERYDCSEP